MIIIFYALYINNYFQFLSIFQKVKKAISNVLMTSRRNGWEGWGSADYFSENKEFTDFRDPSLLSLLNQVSLYLSFYLKGVPHGLIC